MYGMNKAYETICCEIAADLLRRESMIFFFLSARFERLARLQLAPRY